ncbi:MAG: Glycerol-3-phosphate ABC transporter, ATP-binding protein UgpC [uncultured Thermomicrobiales bacterium]|uniref:Glycerol-3-phosphate ABC transporter, ATP-binding protein UgpC n=1 Tax=uncultured Thermomicrobiales bacterium TaxID=1645740 RepID=A0A6J4TJD5_9BACT|nr:MAG: Glycerol-3-phosphate ABC transporter, ATP-binding protein UgpC [uncultured Thermomicrobiales bacterium]
MAVIETRAITKRFGDGPAAVDGIDLASADGEFLVLLGPSGCGKTTLLRMIGGLEPPTSGDVLIGGRVVTGLPPRARKIAMVFQSYALYPHMSVYNNIAFPLKAAKLPKAEQEKKVAWAAGILGIDPYLQRKPRQLSGGQRQRVALARALVRDPNVFLLDEPLSNLDAQRRASARDELQGFQRQIGTTTIYVTHDQVEAMGMGDRIAVINQGTIRQLGTPREIYDEPADTFVATFLGSPPMNLVPRDDLLIGFRPEQFSPAAGASGAFTTFPFHVHREEYLGAERLVYGETGPTKVVARFPITADVPVETGRTYEFAVPDGDLKIFDAASGLRRPGGAPKLVLR